MYIPGAEISCNLRPERSWIVVPVFDVMFSMLETVPSITETLFSSQSTSKVISSSFADAMSLASIASPAVSTMNPPSYILLLPV